VERQYRTRGEISDLHGADPDDLKAVERFANNHGLTVAAISPAGRTVRLTGTLAKLAETFGVQFSLFQSSVGSYRGYSGAARVPDDLSGVVLGVFGLDNRPVARTHLRRQRSTPLQSRACAARAPRTQSYLPNEVATLYDFPDGFDGDGECVAILEFGGGFNPADLTTYFQSIGIPMPEVSAVSVGSATNNPVPGPQSADDEVMLDIEVVGAMAPGAQIVVYFAPNTTLGWLRAISTAIHDSYHNPSIISISWGGPEDSWSRAAIAAMNYEFQVAGALGITICTAAGDQGFTDGVPGTQAHVDFPASSPYVLACGGTRLESAGGNISAESVWNDSADSATGGGVSAIFDLPSYQSDADVPASVNPPHRAGRGVPDVAGDADPNTGYRIRVDGQDVIIGGTSAVAPLWAALLARINQTLGARVGYVNAMLYSQGAAAGAFNDITSGDNGHGGYSAGPGWDACTGLGTPNGTALSEIL
jgi:kumamolisin